MSGVKHLKTEFLKEILEDPYLRSPTGKCYWHQKDEIERIVWEREDRAQRKAFKQRQLEDIDYSCSYFNLLYSHRVTGELIEIVESTCGSRCRIKGWSVCRSTSWIKHIYKFLGTIADTGDVALAQRRKGRAATAKTKYLVNPFTGCKVRAGKTFEMRLRKKLEELKREGAQREYFSKNA